MKQKRKRMYKILSILLILQMVTAPFYGNVEAKAAIASWKYRGDGYEVTYQIDSRQKYTYNGMITVRNTGSETIENWALAFESYNRFSKVWNASVVSYDSGTYLMKNAGWNQDILPGNTVSLGFTAVGEPYFPDTYDIPVEQAEATKGTYQAEFKLDNDWGAGLPARLRLSTKAAVRWRTGHWNSILTARSRMSGTG